MKPVRRVLRLWVAILMVGGTATVGALSLIRAVGTIGEPFAGFFVGPNLLVAISQRANWPGIERGLKSLDHILEVDGARVSTISEFMERVNARGRGEEVTYRVERKGEIREIAVPVSRYSVNDFILVFLLPFLLGLLFVSFGATLYFAQPSNRGSLIYLAFCCAVAVYSLILYEAHTTFLFFRLTLIYPIIGALSAHLFALFPENRLGQRRTRLVVIALYAMAAVLIVHREVAFYEPRESLYLSKFAAFYAVMVLVVDVVLLARAYQQASTQAERDRIKIIFIALFIASSAFSSWSLNFLTVTKSFYLDEQILLTSIFPVFMGYAILRRNIFNLDRVIRLSLSWGTVAAVILILYLGVVGAVRARLSEALYARYSGWILIFLAGLGAYLLHVLRSPVNRLVRRWLFRSQHDVATALAELDRSLASGMTAGELAQRVGDRVTELLNLERGAVVRLPMHPRDDAVVHTFRWREAKSPEKWLPLFETEGFLEVCRRGRPIDLGELAEDRPESFSQSVSALRGNGIEAVVPFVSAGRLFGLLLLGNKLSGDRFDRSDLDALRPVGFRTGLCLENAQLGAEAAQQARLAALGRVASIMVHDIKNPLGTIKISAESLRRRFRPGDRSYELAEIIQEEVDRMNSTVGEILSYVKPRGLSLAPCRINEVVRNVAQRARPELEGAGVVLELDLKAEESEAELDEGRVRRAVENLLDNAREATAAGGRITVRTWSEGKSNGHARAFVAVEDDGPGMDAAVRDRVFQPFFTTKPNGTGLGLAIVRQIVQEHGGEVALESWPGKGTRLTLAFPVRSEAG